MGRKKVPQAGGNLKGQAWDLVTDGATVKIERLPKLCQADGTMADNDVFATDQAAYEFVQRLAELGDLECQGALMDVAKGLDWLVEERVSRRRQELPKRLQELGTAQRGGTQ